GTGVADAVVDHGAALEAHPGLVPDPARGVEGAIAADRAVDERGIALVVDAAADVARAVTVHRRRDHHERAGVVVDPAPDVHGRVVAQGALDQEETAAVVRHTASDVDAAAPGDRHADQGERDRIDGERGVLAAPEQDRLVGPRAGDDHVVADREP